MQLSLASGRVRSIAALSAVLFGSQLTKAATTLFYNGDYNGFDALLNVHGTYFNNGGAVNQYDAYVYDDFIVPVGQQWQITSLFANTQSNFQAVSPTATFDIRQGISEGNGGTQIATGDNAATQTLLSDQSNAYNPNFLLTTALATPVTLSAGTYFLAVALDSGPYYDQRAYLDTTSGANAIGLPLGIDGNSFATNTLPSSNSGAYTYTSTTNAEQGPGPYDYSLGIVGNVTLLPEPSLLPILGAAAALATLRPRRSRRTTNSTGIQSL